MVEQSKQSSFVRVAIIGAFNRGKTSLINALSGLQLSVQPIPNTIEAVEVPMPVWGITFVDTPGYGGLNTDAHAMVRDALAEAPLCLFVFTLDPFPDEEDHTIWKFANEQSQVYAVLTKVDEMSEQDRDVEEAAHEWIALVGDFLRVSVRTGEGIAELQAGLQQLPLIDLQKQHYALKAQQFREQAEALLHEFDTAETDLYAYEQRLGAAQHHLQQASESWQADLQARLEHLSHRTVTALKSHLQTLPPAEQQTLASSKTGLSTIFEILRTQIQRTLPSDLLMQWQTAFEESMDSPLRVIFPDVLRLTLPDPSRGVIPVRIEDRSDPIKAFLTLADRIAYDYAAKIFPQIQAQLEQLTERMGTSLNDASSTSAIQLLRAQRVQVEKAVSTLNEFIDS